jgi:hypothetical protein
MVHTAMCCSNLKSHLQHRQRLLLPEGLDLLGLVPHNLLQDVLRLVDVWQVANLVTDCRATPESSTAQQDQDCTAYLAARSLIAVKS